MPSSSTDSPTVSNQLPTSLTLSWGDAGSDALSYTVTQWSGDDETGSTKTYYCGESLTVNITGLSPGLFYTFAVSSFWSDPGSTPAFGTTPNGTPTTVQMLTGCSMRDGGVWKVAVPYIRESGAWKLASPNVRVATVWKAAV